MVELGFESCQVIPGYVFLVALSHYGAAALENPFPLGEERKLFKEYSKSLLLKHFGTGALHTFKS